MDNDTKDFVNNILPVNAPKAYAACYPRRIDVPGGFTNPKYFAGILAHEMVVASIGSEMEMMPHLTGVLNCFKHLELGVKTYFVRSEFAQAVTHTKPPLDMRLSEIHWPLDAMLFVLPTDFAFRYFGYDVPFLSISRAKAGIYPDSIKLPELDSHLKAIKRINLMSDRFNIIVPMFSQSDKPVDYTATFNMDQTIAGLPQVDYEDATYYEEKIMNIAHSDAPDRPTGVTERAFHDKMVLFCIKMLLVLTARPNIIQNGAITRKAKVLKCKHPRTLDAIWSPNTIGWNYQAPRPKVSSGGTHASPRFHWRDGHLHTVRFGPNWSERRLDWFEAVLVNAPAA